MTLDRAKRKPISVEVTSSMDWLELCKSIIEPNLNEKHTVKSTVEGSVSAFVPGAKAVREESRERKASDSFDYVASVAQNWSERNLISELRERGVVLILDNLEQASQTLLGRLSDLAKGMTDRGPHASAKLILIGTNDIYARLLTGNESISRRLKQITVGAFQHQGEAWAFLKRGFDTLNLIYPETSKYPAEQQKSLLCPSIVYEAAGCLPKSLNELGKNIALRARGARNKFVNFSDIEECSNLHFNQMYKESERQSASVIKLMEADITARATVSHLFNSGVGNIYRQDEITEAVSANYKLSCDEVDMGIEALVSIGFLTRTGTGGDTLFARQQELAHILGVVLRDQSKHQDKAMIRNLSMQLPLPGMNLSQTE